MPGREDYVLPQKLLARKQLKYFNQTEVSFIEACDTLNKAQCYRKSSEKVSKIVMGETMLVSIQTKEGAMAFEFNERHFAGLMKKYRSAKEVRRMVFDIFS